MLLPSRGPGERSKRVYLHEALAHIVRATNDIHMGGVLAWDELDSADAQEMLPDLRHNLSEFAGLVKAIEAIAESKPLARCAECESHFYPSRSDAIYCSGRCRTRAYRRRSR